MEKEKRYPEKGEEGREAWEFMMRVKFCAFCRENCRLSRASYLTHHKPWKYEKPFTAFKENFEYCIGYYPKYDFERRPRKKIYRVGDLVITSEAICAAFGSLTEKQKRAVFMRYVKGIPVKDMVLIERENYAVLKQRAKMGIAKMRKILEAGGV